MELKDQQAKTETVDQQVQAGETVHQQGVHAHCYGASAYYNDCITFPGGLAHFGFYVHKFHTNSTDWSNAMMILVYQQ